MMSRGECQWAHCVNGETSRPWTVGDFAVSGMLRGRVENVGLWMRDDVGMVRLG
jgi:hypothetical protein